jgi:hypothetical protein
MAGLCINWRSSLTSITNRVATETRLHLVVKLRVTGTLVRNVQEQKYIMHWLSAVFYTEAKFGPLEERIKNDWHQSRLNFSEEQPVRRLWSQKEWKNFGWVEKRTSWSETNKTQIKLATTCNKMNSSKMAEIMLNCRPNVRRRPSKRSLDEAETGLSRKQDYTSVKHNLL